MLFTHHYREKIGSVLNSLSTEEQNFLFNQISIVNKRRKEVRR